MHTIRDKKKLLARVRRLRGQVEAIERALVEEAGCTQTLRTIAAARGAILALAAEVLAEHVKEHVAAPELSNRERSRAGREVHVLLRELLR